MRSGMTQISPMSSSSPPLPSIVISSLPIPSIRTPAALRASQSAVTSGSFAVFISRVVPRAKAAAMTMFSVPVTVILSKFIVAPLRPFFAVQTT